MDKRSGEDSVSILFQALEDLSENSGRISRKILITFYLLLGWLTIAILLWAIAVIDLMLADIVVYAALITLVILAMIQIIEIREKLAVVVSRYQAYRHIDSMSISVPPGSDAVDRFLKFLDNTYNFSERLRGRGGKIERNVEIGGVKFDVYAEISGKMFDSLRGVKSYSFYLVWLPHSNTDTVKKIIEVAVNNSKKKNLDLGRIVIITDEISDELYDYILNQNIPVQLVVEMEDGTYDFIPFIGPRPDLLP